jgi:cytochrome c6
MKRIVASTLLTAALVAAPAIAFSATAQENWGQYCAKCHAADGSGKTPVGAKLKVKDYTTADAQAKFTDDEAFKAIKEGVKKPDGKFAMTPYAEKLSDADIQALVTYIRSFKK